jgi:His-Xaa-Ser system radical SAM maturase HxsB
MKNITSRKFRDKSEFVDTLATYFLLPFRFHRLNNKEILVNEVGDYIIQNKGAVEKIINKQVVQGTKLYNDLLSNFFISEQPIPILSDVLATRIRTKKSFLNSFTALHMFVISLRCEHTCKYCQVSRVTQNKDKFDMSYDTIDKSLDLMFKSSAENLTLEFQGGEPLLAFDKVKYTVKKAKRLEINFNKNLSIVICTNLALINDDILQYCKKNNILISTSLDGPRNVHDNNRFKPRASSYDFTIKGIKKAKEFLGDDQVSALMTTTRFSMKYPIEIIDEYRKQGFTNIFLRNISPYGFALRSNDSKYNIDEFIKFYKIGLNYIINLNKKGVFFVEDFTSIILKKILTPFNTGFVDLQSPAGLISSALVYNYNGKIYASDEARMLAENGDETFLLGTVDQIYEDLVFGDKTKEISSSISNEALAGCSDCAFQVYCGADPVYNHTTTGDMYGNRADSDFCKKNMTIIEYLFELMDSDHEANRILRSWIN